MAEPIDYMTAKGWLKDGERRLLHDLAAQTDPDAIFINIGVEFGASLACLRAGNPRAEIYGVDVDMSKVLEDGYGAKLREIDSGAFVDIWTGKGRAENLGRGLSQLVDLVFVDGDHGYTGVLKDAELADFVKEGGYILFQDCYDWDKPGQVHELVPDVNRAVTDWKAAHLDEFEELPHVDTTRIFRRVKVHEFARHSHSDTHVQPKAGPDKGNKPLANQPAVRGAAKNTGRGRQR